MPQLFEVLRDMYEHNNTFPDNVTGDTRDVLLMYSIFKEKDMEAVLLSKSYGEYLSRTRDKDPKMKSLLSEASISVFKTKVYIPPDITILPKRVKQACDFGDEQGDIISRKLLQA